MLATIGPLLAADTPHLNNPCLDTTQPYAKMPWCDSTLPIDTRVQA
tara:strand:+ start:972 stop:1109 length:138 start_codon:yes stop_codon:yes gene_type:complete